MIIKFVKRFDMAFADVDVPQSVKDEYADVLATQNGIKIMKFLDSLPPEQAGSLRVNTPRQNQLPEYRRFCS